MNHEDELSFHESGADVPTWAVVAFISMTLSILAIVVFLILGSIG